MLDSLAVNETEPSTAEQRQLSLAATIGWTALILATLSICYVSHLGALGFVGPDEPRYAWIARDMAETGDWVTPRLYGKPWFEKPPLFYWGAALCFKLFGVSEAAARLPSAVSALLATLAMAWLAWRIYGAETARWLLLLLPTTVGMIGFSHAAATDMPFSGMLTIAMVCAAVVLRLVHEKGETGGASPASTSPEDTLESTMSPSSAQALAFSANPTPWLALILFGFFLGLSVLAKGPAGIVLCGGPVLGWALITKRWRDALRLLHPAAILAFCATALPWYVLCAHGNPDFFRIFIIEHNFKRYLTPEFQHIQPFWFYLPVLLIALLPWAFLFLWSAVSTVARFGRTHRADDFDWFLFCWIGFAVLFFTISKSKLPGYVLPAVPPLAVFSAQAIRSRLSQPRLRRWYSSLTGLTLILMGVLAAYFSAYIPFVTDVIPGPIIGFVFLTVLGGASSIALTVFRRLPASGMAAVLTTLGLTIWGPGLRELDKGVSARPAVRRALERLTPQQLEAATTLKLRRAYKYQVDFYLHRETQEWSPDMKQDSVIFADYKGAEELYRLGGECAPYIAFPAVRVCEGPKRPLDLNGRWR